MREGAAIVGIGETAVGKLPGRNALSLQGEAVQKALADAGIDKSMVDGVYALGSYIQPVQLHGLSVVEYLGLTPRLEENVDVGGTPAFIAMVLNAMAAIDEGRIEVAVCVYGDNSATHRPPGTHGYVTQMVSGAEEFEETFGSSIVVSYALLARRYLDLYGLEPETEFAPIALTMRGHAMLNDNAAYRKPITLEDYRASPWIAEPFRRLDCSPVVDGAGAFVIASRRVARGLKTDTPPVSFLGAGSQVTHKIVSQTPDIPELGMAEAGRRAFAEAGLKPADVDLLTIHDGFTASVSITVEALGFCGPGECGRLAADGGLAHDGQLPVNTHGGLLSQGHVGGMLHVLEAVRQLRGQAGVRQVADARIAAISGNGNIFSICGMMLLGKGLA
jgi:acetyl-CoA acetyltransferase